jgi:hypothetical protein
VIWRERCKRKYHLKNTVLFTNYEWSLSVTLHTTQRTDRRLAAGRCNIRLPSTLLRTLTSDEHRTDPKYVAACMQVYGDTSTYRPRKLGQSFRMTLSYNASTDQEQIPSWGKCSTFSKNFPLPICFDICFTFFHIFFQTVLEWYLEIHSKNIFFQR